jgi:sarcosine oxidase subunit alpha
MKGLRIGSDAPEKRVRISINKKEYTAVRGETVLAALVASGYTSFRKSRKIGERRGPLCGMGVCYECQVSVNGVSNQRACMAEVEDRMEIVLDES